MSHSMLGRSPGAGVVRFATVKWRMPRVSGRAGSGLQAERYEAVPSPSQSRIALQHLQIPALFARELLLSSKVIVITAFVGVCDIANPATPFISRAHILMRGNRPGNRITRKLFLHSCFGAVSRSSAA